MSGTMSGKEKKLVLIAAALALLLLALALLPRLHRLYAGALATRQGLSRQIEQYRALPAAAPYWRGRQQQLAASAVGLERRVFVGASEALIGARTQEALQGLAAAQGLRLTSMSLPEFSRAGELLLLSQTLSFQATAAELPDFLAALPTRGFVLLEANLRAAGPASLTCSLKLAGFGRVSTASRRGNDGR